MDIAKVKSIKKEVIWSLKEIESFHKERAFRIIDNQLPIDNSMAIVHKDESKGFICKILLDDSYNFGPDPDDFDKYEPFVLENSGIKYEICKGSTHYLTYTLTVPQVLKLYLNVFQSGSSEDYNNKKQRLMIPVNTMPVFSGIEAFHLQIDDRTSACSIIKVSIQNLNYEIFKYKDNKTDQSYLIIDSLEINNFVDFKINCDSIITALGYLTGNLYLDQYYYQTFDLVDPNRIEHIRYEKKEQSAITQYPLFDSFSFKQYVESLNRTDILRVVSDSMSIDVFSNLCFQIKTKESFSRACRLIVEGNQSKQTLLKAGILSIALETLSEMINNENIDKSKPIKDKNLERQLRKKVLESIQEFKGKISPSGMKIIESKINDLNKLPNSKKLSMPFEIYCIKLSAEDMEILNYRNSFLHGVIPKIPETKNVQVELEYITLKICFLLNCLILRYVGYTGHLINYPALFRKNNNESTGDHLYILL